MPSTKEHTHHIRIRDTQLEMDENRSRSGDDVEGRLRVAQTQLEELQARREELERIKQETERLNFRRRELIGSQVDMTERFTSSLTLIDRQIFEMRQEMDDLEQCRKCFAGHLSKVEKLNPEAWSRDQLSSNLDRALAIVEHAEDEYSQAAEHFARTRSASIFQGARRGRMGTSEFKQQLIRGLAFNLPILALGTVALVVWMTR